MARVLVERETIYTAEVDMLMKGASYKEVLDYMEEHDKGTPDNPFGRVMNENEPTMSTADAGTMPDGNDSHADMGATDNAGSSPAGEPDGNSAPEDGQDGGKKED